MKSGKQGEQRVEAVERALSILEAFADGASPLSLNDLAQRTGLYRSTILRLAASLERFGYLHRDAEGRFRLGPSLWRLGNLYQNAFDLAAYVRPVLRRLVEETGETAGFYIRADGKRICLYRQNSSKLIRHHFEEGAEFPLDRGASGRILTAYTGAEDAFHAEIRKRGTYVSLGERDPDIAAVAAPVFAVGGRFVGALGISGARSRLDGETCERFAAVVRAEADALSRVLGSGGEAAS